MIISLQSKLTKKKFNQTSCEKKPVEDATPALRRRVNLQISFKRRGQSPELAHQAKWGREVSFEKAERTGPIDVAPKEVTGKNKWT